MCWCSTRNFCIQYFCWAAFFLKDFFPFFGGIFFWSCCGRLPSGSCLQNDSCFSVRDPRSDIGLLQNERFVQDFRHKQQGTSPGILSCQTSGFLSFLPFLLPSFLPFPPSLPSFLPSLLPFFLPASHKQSKDSEQPQKQKATKANRSLRKSTQVTKSQQKPAKTNRSEQQLPEATKSHQKPTKATRSHQNPTEANKSHQKRVKATRSQQKPPEASKSYQKPPEANKSHQKPPKSHRSQQKPPKASKSHQKPAKAARS